MKSRLRFAAVGLSTTLICSLCLPARAQWSSLRGNNRSAPAARTSPRAAQPAFRGHEDEHAQRPAVEAGREREEHREMERGRVVEPGRTGREAFEHWAPERRHWDIDEDRHHAYPWFGINPGFVIGTLPPGYDQIYVGGNPYYYDQGVYYQPGASGYVAVTPPIGAVVPQLPPGAEPIQVGPTTFYYAGGAFYVQQPQGFLVVTPPPGISVTTLPPGATPVNINGVMLYQADGAYFQPMIQGGITVYTTVQP